ncbi:hypothetical protein COW53_02520 [bacterium CG17_big_fil_post_rev_8_21_14_2_50_64_8]|nr:MAG: hypothetical protein COW53_02520 [bacterium CG17_big_fil_post_rev_8_21_14_2_50_64_8]
MSKTLKTLMIVFGLLVLIGLGACSSDVTTVLDPGASLCFNCHSDQDTYLIDKQMEWAYSSHGIGNYVAYAGGRSGCSGCHSGAGFEARLAGETEVPYATPIRCFSCHAPHSNANFNLRVTEPQPLASGYTMDLGVSNLCTACHVGRTSVDDAVPHDATEASVTSTHWGAHHGPQGDLFMGQNGYEYDGVTYRRAVPPAHNTDESRCFGCHGNDNPAIDLGGHSFIQDNGADEDNLNVASCNRCHSDLEDFDVNDVQTEVEDMMAELQGLLIGMGLLDSEGGLIKDVTGTPDEIGAVWNYILVEEDRSAGVHNPDYIRDLLQGSLDYLNSK